MQCLILLGYSKGVRETHIYMYSIATTAFYYNHCIETLLIGPKSEGDTTL